MRQFNAEYFKALERIVARVDKWPQWKKEGWAVLDSRPLRRKPRGAKRKQP